MTKAKRKRCWGVHGSGGNGETAISDNAVKRRIITLPLKHNTENHKVQKSALDTAP